MRGGQPTSAVGARHLTKSAPRFPATQSPGTSDSKVSGELLDLRTAGIDHFVAGLEAVGRQFPLFNFNYPEIHIKRFTCVLQSFMFHFPYIILKLRLSGKSRIPHDSDPFRNSGVVNFSLCPRDSSELGMSPEFLLLQKGVPHQSQSLIIDSWL